MTQKQTFISRLFGQKSINTYGEQEWYGERPLGGGDAKLATVDELLASSSWYFAAMDKRASAVSSIPFVFKRSTRSRGAEYTENELPFSISARIAFYRMELDWLSYGESFLMGIANRSGHVRKVRHVTRSNIKAGTLRGQPVYIRTLNKNEKQVFSLDRRGNWVAPWGKETLYLFHLQTPSNKVEDGAMSGGTAVGDVARLDSNILYNMNIVLNEHFGSGSLNRVYATTNANMGDSTRVEALKAYLNRFLRGAGTYSKIQVLRDGFKFNTIPNDLKSLMVPEISRTREDAICVAFGTPRAIIVGDMTNRGDDDNLYKSWMSTTIIPRLGMMIERWENVVAPVVGFTVEAQPKKMAIFQSDIGDSVDNVKKLVDSGETLENAYSIIGIPLPEDYQAPTTADEPIAEEVIEVDRESSKTYELAKSALERQAEKKTFARWITKRVKAGKGFALSEFESDLLDNESIKRIATGQLFSIAVKQVKITDEAQSIVDAFEEASDSVHRDLQDGRITADQHKARFDELIRDAMTAVFLIGYGVDSIQGLSNDAAQELEVMIEEQQGYTDSIRQDLIAGVYTKALIDRVKMWGNTVASMFGLGRLFGRKEKQFVWKLGATEQHCATCLDQSGNVKTAAEWLELRKSSRIYPQSRELECKGYRCDCRYEEVQ